MSDATKQKKKTKISAREKQAVLEEMAMFKAFLRFCVESKQMTQEEADESYSKVVRDVSVKYN